MWESFAMSIKRILKTAIKNAAHIDHANSCSHLPGAVACLGLCCSPLPFPRSALDFPVHPRVYPVASAVRRFP
jgi:hypothetical protein